MGKEEGNMLPETFLEKVSSHVEPKPTIPEDLFQAVRVLGGLPRLLVSAFMEIIPKEVGEMFTRRGR